ncbi:MAG: DUF1566 domain-containing protein [Flavobacteriaceae bacterium]|nr:DUF1566 domain-containing protein [Flavobacteriaceae bacterium]
MFKKTIAIIIIGVSFYPTEAQKLLPFKLSDTGQSISTAEKQGEDADFLINPPSFTNNGNGTITDNNSGLMWQKTDGGEMTFEVASDYCKNLNLGEYYDWRLPTGIELFSINNYNYLKPALDTTYFTDTNAEYWWTSETRADDASKVWVVNAGGGIGAHPKSETTSAGGSKSFHVRAVRNLFTTSFSAPRFTEKGDSTIMDNYTGLSWQKFQSPAAMTWEEALAYAKTCSLSGKLDWRLPNIKELQSLNDPKLTRPSFNKTYFPNIGSGNYWSSTSMFRRSNVAWDINTSYGIVSYNDMTKSEYVLLVRGGLDN